jgi:haloacetate dehalogenase
MLLPDFERRRVEVGDVALHVATAGSGPPLVLLHGYPLTHVCWHAVAPRLAERFTVVCPDLRGYGESDKPPGDAAHERYAKRTMARDILALMRALGHTRFAVVGHDRGGLVGYRLALDAPEAVSRLAVLGVLPAEETWEALAYPFALGAYHLYLLAQPPDFPERLLGAAPDLVLEHTLDSWCGTPGALVPEARAAYARAFRDPRTLHAVCEDYRAGASADVAHDRADRERARRITAPLLVLWEQPEGLELPFDPLAVWRRWATDVGGHPLPCGHFLPEERPAEVAEAVGAFLARAQRDAPDAQVTRGAGSAGQD